MARISYQRVAWPNKHWFMGVSSDSEPKGLLYWSVDAGRWIMSNGQRATWAMGSLHTAILPGPTKNGFKAWGQVTLRPLYPAQSANAPWPSVAKESCSGREDFSQAIRQELRASKVEPQGGDRQGRFAPHETDGGRRETLLADAVLGRIESHPTIKPPNTPDKLQ
ncbi:hypothetical protein M406DRAFT_331104 [Cryphonectria parasitica EP155]|uniref:Uncharacterized protein n=1 Tax=Cryphonectria parasitica (strain ATCC 38755 / EP155) TaxID=660469 RepID=A0A9P4Y0K6_CRYP1|nr:uncharacterized protein M406DRAFT_331104 [Cryphonectria parasitica EP155]KAF3764784.1 hypothetical protein M406DRAFT_331104 [Cryphonectria parasitica EP155]